MQATYANQTVYIIGAAPSVTDAQLEQSQAHPCIAANRGIQRAPWCEVLVALDGNWPAEAEGLTCLKVTGATWPHPHERVRLGPNHAVEIRNNALSAIRYAAAHGTKHIVVLGVDCAAYEALHNFAGLSQGLAALVDEMGQAGVQIEVLAAEEAGTATPPKSKRRAAS